MYRFLLVFCLPIFIHPLSLCGQDLSSRQFHYICLSLSDDLKFKKALNTISRLDTTLIFIYPPNLSDNPETSVNLGKCIVYMWPEKAAFLKASRWVSFQDIKKSSAKIKANISVKIISDDGSQKNYALAQFKYLLNRDKIKLKIRNKK